MLEIAQLLGCVAAILTALAAAARTIMILKPSQPLADTAPRSLPLENAASQLLIVAFLVSAVAAVLAIGAWILNL